MTAYIHKSHLSLGALALLLMMAPTGANAAAEASTPTVGAPAPRFLIGDLQGGRLGLRDLTGDAAEKNGKGKALTLLSFWSLSCIPCRAEMPELQKFAAAHPDEVRLIFVNVDVKDKTEEVRLFAREHNLNETVLLDIYQVTGKGYGVCTGNLCKVPALFGISKDGRLLFSMEGFETPPQLHSQLERELTLAKALPPPATAAAALGAPAVDGVEAETRFQALHKALLAAPHDKIAAELGLTREQVIEILKSAERTIRPAWKLP
jgi:thiol-disulfide isomerase/thioredoxin